MRLILKTNKTKKYSTVQWSIDVTVEVYKHNEAQRGKDFLKFMQLVCGRAERGLAYSQSSLSYNPPH